MANSVQRSNTARQTTAPQANFPEHFQQKYESHLKHLTLKRPRRGQVLPLASMRSLWGFARGE